MSCCARCGQGICSTSGKIALNKVWHRGCFSCYQCNCPLDINSAKIYYGEVFCKNCYCKIVENCSTPIPFCSPKPACLPKSPKKCQLSPPLSPCTSCHLTCKPKDTHSCSCLPACCPRQEPPPQCQCTPKRIHCRPKSPKPLNYPPRQQNNPCLRRCRSPSPARSPPCCPPVRNNCTCSACCGERCKRCGEKVFAAEKIATSAGPYHIGCFTCYCCCKSLCVKTMYEGSGEIFCQHCYKNYFGINDYGYTVPSSC